jgi:hypothetical protein
MRRTGSPFCVLGIFMSGIERIERMTMKIADRTLELLPKKTRKRQKPCRYCGNPIWHAFRGEYCSSRCFMDGAAARVAARIEEARRLAVCPGCGHYRDRCKCDEYEEWFYER